GRAVNDFQAKAREVPQQVGGENCRRKCHSRGGNAVAMKRLGWKKSYPIDQKAARAWAPAAASCGQFIAPHTISWADSDVRIGPVADWHGLCVCQGRRRTCVARELPEKTTSLVAKRGEL